MANFLRDKTPEERRMLNIELRRRTLQRKKIMIALENSLAAVKKKFPFVKGAYIFGSFATGNIMPRDLDLMLVINFPKFLRFEGEHPEMTEKYQVGGFYHKARAYNFAQGLLSDLLKKEVGLAIGTEFRQGHQMQDFGFLFFDPEKPEVTLGSLIDCKIYITGQKHTKREKHKFPFGLRQWHFVGTPTEVVNLFAKEWDKIKDRKEPNWWMKLAQAKK